LTRTRKKVGSFRFFSREQKFCAIDAGARLAVVEEQLVKKNIKMKTVQVILIKKLIGKIFQKLRRFLFLFKKN